MIDYYGVIMAGLVATAIFDVWAEIARRIGMTSMRIEKTLGSMFAEGRKATFIGATAHWLAGVIIAVIYAGIFEYIGTTSGWFTGGIIGLVHALLIGSIIMPIIGVVHPLMRAGKMELPGFFAVNKGRASPAYIIVGHMIFGSTLGAAYLFKASW